MAILCPPLFKSDLSLFGLTVSAETADSIWFGTLSGIFTTVLLYGAIQAFHKLRGKKLSRSLDFISFLVLLISGLLLSDYIGTLLFNN